VLPALATRPPSAADHPRILRALDEWWGGLGGEAGRRERSLLLPRLFLQHFADTSYIVERADGSLGAFLIGLHSQSRPDVAYVHFVGVAPDLRRRGLAASLYERFLDAARAAGARKVQAITSPSNVTSQAFHQGIGFELDASETVVDGLPVQRDYDGPGIDRVAFTLQLQPAVVVGATRREGGCACGSVRYRLESDPLFVNCCHCLNCQRQTGSAFVINLLIEADRVKLLAALPRPVEVPCDDGSTQRIFRCATCQVAVFSEYGRPELRYVRAGTLDRPSAVTPDVHLFTRSKVGWIRIPDSTPAFDTSYDPQAVWPASSLARLEAILA
jgi:N-acetylglutamate synthase-like GNAT family acetyltransferase